MLSPGSLFVLFDGDEAGQQNALELAKKLYQVARLADIRKVKDKFRLDQDADESQRDPNGLHVKLGTKQFSEILSYVIANAVDVFDLCLNEFAQLEASDTTTVNEKLT